MTDQNNITGSTTLQELSKLGGKARADKLSPERRKEIALKASHSRGCMKDIPKATHQGKLFIGELEIDCAVLENGKRIISESSAFEILGRQRKGRKKEMDQLPAFLNANNLQKYLSEDFLSGTFEIEYFSLKNSKCKGFEASFIPKICQVYLEARRAGVLTPQQQPAAAQAEIVIQALANIGILALIDECTGFQKYRENDDLQKLFSKFIAAELQPWVKRFPPEFFNHLKRMYGLEEMKKTPKFFGHLIQKWIYKQLSPEIHEELKRLNPVTDAGYRKHCHHQLLTTDIGCPALNKQIQKVTTLLSVSDSKEDFERLLEKSK